jgi:5S rRNA maturation endonuclease (ribonuclease M5)
LFESAIDALSFRSMNPDANGTYIVLNGSALVNRIHEVTDQTDKVYLCFDNDEQGTKFCDKISQQVLCEVEIIKPVSKDFNEDLINGNYTSPKGSLDLSSRNPKIG